MMKIFQLTSATLVVALLVCHAFEAFSSNAFGMEKASRFRLKRSLCNTFGGCGTKRSPIQQRLDLSDTINDGIPRDQSESVVRNGRRTSTELFAEILADLTNYLQRKESDRSGKYVVVFAKQPDGSLKPTIISTSPTVQSNDPVEVQIGQLEFGKDD